MNSQKIMFKENEVFKSNNLNIWKFWKRAKSKAYVEYTMYRLKHITWRVDSQQKKKKKLLGIVPFVTRLLRGVSSYFYSSFW